MLDISNLSKTFNGKKVVNDVSLSLDKGKIIGLLGPNGAGKTTVSYTHLTLPTNREV